MGLSVEQWRAVCGGWSGGRSSGAHQFGALIRKHGPEEDVDSAGFLVVTLFVIAALLLIGGVEMNPGPDNDSVTEEGTGPREGSMSEDPRIELIALIAKMKEQNKWEMEQQNRRIEELEKENRQYCPPPRFVAQSNPHKTYNTDLPYSIAKVNEGAMGLTSNIFPTLAIPDVKEITNKIEHIYELFKGLQSTVSKKVMSIARDVDIQQLQLTIEELETIKRQVENGKHSFQRIYEDTNSDQNRFKRVTEIPQLQLWPIFTRHEERSQSTDIKMQDLKQRIGNLETLVNQTLEELIRKRDILNEMNLKMAKTAERTSPRVLIKDKSMPSNKDMQPKGSGTVTRSRYELKMLALIYMRALNSGQPFFLTTNVETAGAFDDIVLSIKSTTQDNWTTLFIKLKNLTGHGKVGYERLLGLSAMSDFGLVTYCESFMKIKTKYCTNANEWPLPGVFEDYQFLVYTNAQPDAYVNTFDNKSKVGMDPMIVTNNNGSAFHFSTESNLHEYFNEIIYFKLFLKKITSSSEYSSLSAKWKESLAKFEISQENKELETKKRRLMDKPSKEHLVLTLKELSSVGDLSSYEQFLNQFYLYTGQSEEGYLEVLISDEIQKAFNSFDASDVSKLLTCLIESVEKLSAQKNVGSQDHIPWITEKSRVLSTSVLSFRIAQLSIPKLIRLESVPLMFNSKSNEHMFNYVKKYRQLNLVVKEGTNSQVAAQLFQALPRVHVNNYIFAGAKVFLKRKDEMRTVWQHSLCQGLVIDCDQPLSEDDTIDLASHLIDTIRSRQDLSLVLISTKDDRLTEALLPVMMQVKVHCQWNDLSTDFQKQLLKSTQCNFQGHTIPLGTLLGDDIKEVNQQLHGCELSSLMNDKLKVGKDLKSIIDHHIPRRITRGAEDLYVRSLANVPDKVVLLIADPGEGKTTCITHLAQEVKRSNPSTWVVTIDLAKCTTYLASLKSDRIYETTAIDFLTHFATDTSVDKRILKHRVLFSGNVIMFLDNADKVVPAHACSLIRELVGTKITAIWVTSCSAAKHSLESALNVRSFRLSGSLEEL